MCHRARIRGLESCREDAKGEAQAGHPSSAKVPMPRAVRVLAQYGQTLLSRLHYRAAALRGVL